MRVNNNDYLNEGTLLLRPLSRILIVSVLHNGFSLTVEKLLATNLVSSSGFFP